MRIDPGLSERVGLSNHRRGRMRGTSRCILIHVTVTWTCDHTSTLDRFFGPNPRKSVLHMWGTHVCFPPRFGRTTWLLRSSHPTQPLFSHDSGRRIACKDSLWKTHTGGGGSTSRCPARPNAPRFDDSSTPPRASLLSHSHSRCPYANPGGSQPVRDTRTADGAGKEEGYGGSWHPSLWEIERSIVTASMIAISPFQTIDTLPGGEISHPRRTDGPQHTRISCMEIPRERPSPKEKPEFRADPLRGMEKESPGTDGRRSSRSSSTRRLPLRIIPTREERTLTHVRLHVKRKHSPCLQWSRSSVKPHSNT